MSQKTEENDTKIEILNVNISSYKAFHLEYKVITKKTTKSLNGSKKKKRNLDVGMKVS